MLKSNKHIEIVRSTVKGLSSMSQESCDAIFAVLAKYYTNVGVSTVDNLADLEAVVDRNPDLVFLGMEFIPADSALGADARTSRKIWLTTYLAEHHIAYTGSDQTAHELQRNKHLAKQRVLDSGLQTAAFCLVKRSQSSAAYRMPLAFPVFIKPTDRGGGFGIDSDSVAYNAEQMRAKTQSIAHDLKSDSLIETYLMGREFSVAILRQKHTDEFAVMPIELIAPLDEREIRILSGKVKSSNAEQAVAISDRITRNQVAALALDTFYALGARDYGRIDIRLDEHGVPNFLEANLIPSLISGYGSFPKACLINKNLAYEPMIVNIAELGLERATDYDEEASLAAVDSGIFPLEVATIV